ncbi:MAG: helix-turn-helix domain-containing protein [Thermomicrobiales bacterium]
MDSAKLVTVAEAAKRLERSTEQVRRYLREERLTGQRLGGQWFIDRAALDAFHEKLGLQSSFLDNVSPANQLDPMGATIGIGHGGGGDIAKGKDAYRHAFWWRR